MIPLVGNATLFLVTVCLFLATVNLTKRRP
jgi:hypothetical protein